MRIEIKAQADAEQLMGLRLQRALGRLLIFPICAAIGTLFTQISTGPRLAAMKVMRVASEKVVAAIFFLFHSLYFEWLIFYPQEFE
jgi:formate hydrogenlyase subunit 3/multisubunit Na+/H+ antiporter MnhD subunit